MRDFNYVAAMAIVGFGFLMLVWEICYEPELLRRPIWAQIVCLGLCFGCFDVVFISCVSAYAPLNTVSYCPRNGQYSPETNISGITWNEHFSDLRVAFTNPTDTEYKDMDMNIFPDAWIYTAVIYDNQRGCSLTRLHGATLSTTVTKGGATKLSGIDVGEDTVVHDNAGDVFEILATKGGYRLICDKIPSHYTIQVVFAVVSLSSLVASNIKGHISALELSGVESKFDLFGPRPLPQIVKVERHFTKKYQPFSDNYIVKVKDEDGN